MTRQRGVTLVELLLAIVVVGIAASTLLGVFSTTVASSADPMIRFQAAAVAEAYLDEVMLRPFIDPDGSDGETSRAAFDDLDDYNGLVDVGARNQFGTPIPELSAYTVSVSVNTSSGLGGLPSSEVVRVDVRVTRGDDVNFVLSGYRTDY